MLETLAVLARMYWTGRLQKCSCTFSLTDLKLLLSPYLTLADALREKYVLSCWSSVTDTCFI